MKKMVKTYKRKSNFAPLVFMFLRSPFFCIWLRRVLCSSAILRLRRLFSLPASTGLCCRLRQEAFNCEKMAASPSIKAWKILFASLGLVMLATLVYTICTDGSPFHRELLTPWLSATLVDFYVNVFVISVWVAYKESSWLSTCFWVILLVCFGSISTCIYILKQLFNISGQDSSQDPLQLVLLRKDGENKVTCSYIVLGRIVFCALGVIMSVIVIYTLITDGSPFRMELLTPWMVATLIDFYINVFAISVWVFHKESTWISAIFWICLLICLGSIASCAYIVVHLFKLSCQDTTYNVVKDSHRKHAKESTLQ